MADSTPSMDDEALAALLGPGLKPARGPAPKLSHIRAALLMARDAQLESREACRRVAGVAQGAKGRVAALAPPVMQNLANDHLTPKFFSAAKAAKFDQKRAKIFHRHHFSK